MDYKKKLEESKFIKFREYSSLNFAVGASLFIGVIILLFSLDFAKKSFNILYNCCSIIIFFVIFSIIFSTYKIKKRCKK